MATGKQHDAATRFFSVPTSIIAGIWVGQFWAAIGVFLGFAVTLFVNPDLDIDGRTDNETWLRQNFGCLGLLWQVYWSLYAFAIPHRSVFSHGVLIGTALRYLYVFWPILAWIIMLDEARRYGYIVVMFWVFVGMSVSDLLHIVMDSA